MVFFPMIGFNNWHCLATRGSVPQEYDEQAPADPEEVHEALRGGHAFKRLPVEAGPAHPKHHADVQDDEGGWRDD